MRMSNLIEDCEDDLEFGIDLEEASAGSQRRTRERQMRGRNQLGMAIRAADRDPSKKCPEGFRRNAKGKCQSAHSLDRESSERSAKAVNQYKAMPMGGGEKKPSLVDRMKAMFGKK